MKQEVLLLSEFLKKYKHIGTVNYEEIIDDLNTLNSVESQLDYLVGLKHKFIDKYEEVNKSLSKKENLFLINNRSVIWESIFGKNTPETTLRIPSVIFDTFFKDSLSNPEVTFWFLKHNSKELFNDFIASDEFKAKIESNLKNTHLEAMLKQLENLEANADTLLRNNEIDIYKYHANNYKYKRELVLSKVLSLNYFKENTIPSIGSYGLEVQTFYQHIYLKPYLEELLKEENSLIKKTKNEFTIDKKSKLFLKDLFAKDDDYNNVINSLIENEFIATNGDDTFRFKKLKEDPSLAIKTLICTLGIILYHKDYLDNEKHSLTSIAHALTNTFKVEISVKTYGVTYTNFSSKENYSKPFYFIN